MGPAAGPRGPWGAWGPRPPAQPGQPCPTASTAPRRRLGGPRGTPARRRSGREGCEQLPAPASRRRPVALARDGARSGPSSCAQRRGTPRAGRSAGPRYLLFICLSAFPPRERSREVARGARQRKDLATARQERREAASSESRQGRAGVGAPAPTPEERRTERPSGAMRPECHRRRCAGAAGAAVQPTGQCPGSCPMPTRHPATYFPWRTRSGGGQRGSQPAGVVVEAVGRQHQAAAGVAAGVAARRWACSPRCAWCPLRWVMPERECG